MNNKERLMTALDRGTPDMVPVWELAFNEASIIGIARHFMEDDKLPPVKPVADMSGDEMVKMVFALIHFIKELDNDGVTAIWLPGRERVDEQHTKDGLGVIYKMCDVGEPMVVDGPIKEPSDLKGFKLRRPQEPDYIMLDVLRKAFPDKAVAFHTAATFKYSWSLRGGMDKLLIDYIERPEFVHELARIVTDMVIEAVEIGMKKGADFFVLDGDLAYNPGPLMSPAHYQEYIMPYHAEIIAKVHEMGGKVIKHSDGNLTPLIPYLIEAGVDGIHPIQPQCMDIAETKAEFGDRVCVLGNIDCAFLLVFGSEEEVRQGVKDTIAKAAPGGGYIISSSNSIHPGVKPENYIAMVKAAREFGNY
jgi:uroporphyrinogen decarboxylase